MCLAEFAEVFVEDALDTAGVDGGETDEGGVDGATEGRAEDVFDFGGVWEGGAEGAGLLFAVWGEVGVAERCAVDDAVDVVDCLEGERKSVDVL